MAYSDEPWTNDGAAVRISIVCQDDGSELEISLDGTPVPRIFPDLTSGTAYIASASELRENAEVAFQGNIRNGPFDLTNSQGLQFIAEPLNVNGLPNSDVVLPFVNAHDLAQRPRGAFIIDFGQNTDRKEAAQYEAPWKHASEHVQPYRREIEDEKLRTYWWLHEAWSPSMRAAIATLKRFVATPITSKHRFYVWLEPEVLPDATVVAIARENDYTFGILHSRIHEAWALRHAPRIGAGNDPRYTHTACFNTFPFPWPLNTPDSELTSEQQRHRDTIADAAKALHEQRDNWLNPHDGDPAQLQDRTMTNLYNERPDWLSNLHDTLDEAVFAAYGWPSNLTDDEILERLLELNQERAAAQDQPPTATDTTRV